MIRKSQPFALPILLAASLAMSTRPVTANPILIPNGQTVTTSTETRRVQTKEKEVVRGDKEITERSPYTQEQIISPTTKLVGDWETESYKVKVTSYSQEREEQREKTTTTNHYIRRTLTQVVDKTWSTWVVGGYLKEGYHFSADLGYMILSGVDFRKAAQAMTTEGYKERSDGSYAQSNIVFMNIVPYSDSNHMRAYLVFDKALNFQGGFIICHGSGRAKVPSAKIIRYSDHDAIQYQLNCERLEDWNPLTSCGSENQTWTLHLTGRILEYQTRATYKDVHVDEPYDETTYRYGPWVATGTMFRLQSRANPPTVSYETGTENTLISERFVARTENVIMSIGSGDRLDGRRIFKGDAGGAGQSSALSGAQVREQLKAHRATQPVPNPKPPSNPGKSNLNSSLPTEAAPESWFFPTSDAESQLRLRFESYRRKTG